MQVAGREYCSGMQAGSGRHHASHAGTPEYLLVLYYSHRPDSPRVDAASAQRCAQTSLCWHFQDCISAIKLHIPPAQALSHRTHTRLTCPPHAGTQWWSPHQQPCGRPVRLHLTSLYFTSSTNALAFRRLRVRCPQAARALAYSITVSAKSNATGLATLIVRAPGQPVVLYVNS